MRGLSRYATPWRVAAGVAAVVVAIVWARLALHGIRPYGSDGAQYIEHWARLQRLEAWRAADSWNLWTFLVDTDGSFPSGLHLLTLPVGAVIGHGAEAAAATGAIWLVLLALATGSVAAQIGGRRPEVGAVAMTAVLLVPALQGLATRYYFDLPMTALLWAMVAVIVITRERAPVVGGLVAGALLFVACVVKWSAIPQGAILAVAALAAPLPSGAGHRTIWPRLAIHAGLVAAVPAGLIALYMAGIDGVSSFGHQAHLTVTAAQTMESPMGDATNLLGGRLGEIELVDLVFHPLRLVLSILSPALAVLWALFAWRWLRGERRGGLFVAAAVLGTLAFLLLMVPPLDDRFLVPIVPALAIVAALGWSEGGPRRGTLSALAIGVALLVAADFHFGPSTPLTAELEVLGERAQNSPRTVARGVGLASSVEQRGWVRADEQEPARRDFRERLYLEARRCDAQCIGVRTDEGAIDERGDAWFWRYRALRDKLDADRAEERFVVQRCAPERECEPDLVLSPSSPDRPDTPPRCVGAGWELAARVDDPDRPGWGAALWRPTGAPACD